MLDKLKAQLMLPPMLTYPFCTNASKDGLGAVLEQEYEG